jgi:O-antigen/teichoic acid export membrane protein
LPAGWQARLQTRSRPNWLHWDREATEEFFRFGRWIFFSTIMGYIANQGDRLMMGRLLSLAELGMYGIAANLGFLMVDVSNRLSQQVLYPMYARLVDQPRALLRAQVLRARLWMMGAMLPPLYGLVLFGPEIIDLLYDDRYAGAGWMLQILAVASIVRIVHSIGPIYLAYGNSALQLVVTTTYSATLLASILAGGWLGGTTGVLYGVVASRILAYPVVSWVAARYGMWMPLIDLAGYAVSALVVALSFYLR